MASEFFERIFAGLAQAGQFVGDTYVGYDESKKNRVAREAETKKRDEQKILDNLYRESQAEATANFRDRKFSAEQDYRDARISQQHQAGIFDMITAQADAEQQGIVNTRADRNYELNVRQENRLSQPKATSASTKVNPFFRDLAKSYLNSGGGISADGTLVGTRADRLNPAIADSALSLSEVGSFANVNLPNNLNGDGSNLLGGLGRNLNFIEELAVEFGQPAIDFLITKYGENAIRDSKPENVRKLLVSGNF